MNSTTDSKQNKAQKINDARKPSNITQLPTELIAENFFKLPITTLFHCKYVCKSWRALFSNPNFTTDLFSRTPDWLLIHVSNSSSGDKFSLVDIDKKLTLDLPRDPNYVHLGAHIKGSCNGLLLRKDSCYPYLGRYCISNPMTGECLAIPECYIKPSVVGFGFSSISHVYKVVFMQPKKKEVWVINVGSKIWRKLEISNFQGAVAPQNMIYLNGFLHVVCSSRNKVTFQEYLYGGYSASTRSLRAFDVETEQVQEFPAPSTLEEDQSSTHWNIGDQSFKHWNLGVMRGCLSLFVSDRANMECWVMNDYGVKESWTNLYVFQTRDMFICRVLMYFKEEEQVLALYKKQLRFCSVRQLGGRRLVVSNEDDDFPREIKDAFFYTPNFTLLSDMIKS